MIGISYLEFPNMVSNPFENFTENYKKYKYKEQCEGGFTASEILRIISQICHSFLSVNLIGLTATFKARFEAS